MRKRPIVQKLEETNSSEVEQAAEVCRSACFSLWDSFLAVDHRMTCHLAVCATKESTWGNLRPLMKILEISCHGVPWIAGAVLLFLFSHKSEDIEVSVNLFFALIFDLIIVGLLKMTFRRGRPSHNIMDIFIAPSVDKFSFPSGHATRAVMMTLFLCQHMITNKLYMAAVVIWAVSVCMSRILLGRHHIFDVVCGICVGVIAYFAYLNIWVSKDVCLSYLDSYFGYIHV
ncbi:unnamed protein product [Candidula unifasciata]|uniref:Phosphatidic acid phosphatase type 2/haloperoxidase domain-containing protein n=1 Tax=Candidula unifasciata TaxID=100452 RepID=A0A8S3ZZU7_9EUPU|nr:unnamed protein product [Candidula unifasciata]